MANIDFKGGTKMMAALERIANDSGKAKSVSIGFMQGATYPDGTSVPLIAALMNYGTRTIPPRPFFSNMVRAKSPSWGKSLGAVLIAQAYDGEAALKGMGMGISSQLQSSILSTNSPRLAQSTIDRKGFDKPLIDTSHMINSVQYSVDGAIYDGERGLGI